MLARREALKKQYRTRQKTNILQLKIWQKTTWAWHKYKKQLPIKRVKQLPNVLNMTWHCTETKTKYLNVKYCYSAVHKTFRKKKKKKTCPQKSART